MSNIRTVTFFSTKGHQKVKVETNAARWGELAATARDNGYDLDRLHATESVNKTDLVHPDGILPEGPFTIFLRPKKTKSGLDAQGLSFRELRQLVKDNKETEGFMEHMHGDGNYTQLSTEALRERLEGWNPSTEDVDQGYDTDYEESQEDVTEESFETAEPTPLQKVEAIDSLLEDIREAFPGNMDIDERIDYMHDELQGLRAEIELGSETEEERLEREENQRLADEADELCQEIGC